MQLREEIEKLPGAWALKDQVDTLVNRAVIAQQRKEAGLATPPLNTHMVITGNAGTGKTTFSRKLGELMFELGQTASPEVVQLQRQDLAGKFTNTAAQDTYDLITKNRGKVIMIDEAYTLYTGPDDEVGIQVVNELMRLAEEYKDDTTIILVGYKDEIDNLLAVNQGLYSRFPTRLDLPDLTPSEKAGWLDVFVGDSEYEFADDAAKSLASKYASRVPSGGEDGNARAVKNFYEMMIRVQESRLVESDAEPTRAALSQLTADDVREAAIRSGIPPIASVNRNKSAERRRRKKDADVVEAGRLASVG